MATTGKSARNKGLNYERKIRKEFIELGWDKCVTSRYGSKEMDDAKVDLIHTEPYNIQCKAIESAQQYAKILKSMPKTGINVVFHKRDSFELVVLTKKDFYDIIRSMHDQQH